MNPYVALFVLLAGIVLTLVIVLALKERRPAPAEAGESHRKETEPSVPSP